MQKGVAGRTALLLFVALGFAGAGLATRHFLAPAEPPMGPPSGLRHAEFWAARLPDLANRQQAMAQWQGKVVVVNFWAPWCPPCRKEIPGFIALQEKFGEQGLQFIGVALDRADRVKAYATQAGINYPLLLGGDEAVRLGQAAGNRLGGLPYTVVFDRNGNAIAALSGAVPQTRMQTLVQPLL